MRDEPWDARAVPSMRACSAAVEGDVLAADLHACSGNRCPIGTGTSRRGQQSRDVRVLLRALLNSQVLDKQNRHGCCAASAATPPDLAVEEFPGKVQMPGMSRGLLDHVQHDPANI